jgi:peptide/nickel transport system ATP-binding protein
MKMNNNDRNPLLGISNLKTYFYLREGIVKAVDGVNIIIRQGQTVGIVGESGCGKSITARSILRIVPTPGKEVGGKILYYGKDEKSDKTVDKKPIDLLSCDPKGSIIRNIRGKEIAMIFQEPMTSLSPIHTIGNQIIETIILHQHLSKDEARAKAADILGKVGISQPLKMLNRYPDEFSGGMRQRVMIAMALSCNPSLLIADEPTTALDVTTQAQILRLIKSLQDELDMAVMYISHNLSVIAQITDYVIVMYLGYVVEEADVYSLFEDPKHPYTKALFNSLPGYDKNRNAPLKPIKGSIPDPFNRPKGCPFHPRCKQMIKGLCDVEIPSEIEISQGHHVRCHLYD